MTGDRQGRAAELDPEARAEAHDALADALTWRLAPARWAQVDEIVESMAAALAAGDAEALRRATVSLEMAVPVRITRIGATQEVPPPERTRERLTHLVHSLSLEPPAAGEVRANRHGQGDDRGCPPR